jgi:hypothetical protein
MVPPWISSPRRRSCSSRSSPGLGAAGILALAGRGLPDPGGRRIDAVYLFTVLAVTLYLSLFSGVGAVGGALALALRGRAVWTVTVRSSGELHRIGSTTDPFPWRPGPPPRTVVYGPMVAGPDPVRP